MRTAIIAPIPLLSQFAMLSEGYHLVLASLVQSSEPYREFYKALSDRDQFVILDNDAHEHGVGQSYEVLGSLYKLLHPSEIVLPDRLFMGDDTYYLSKETFEAFHHHEKSLPLFMGVPQGRTLDEWLECAEKLLVLGIDTIGISKDFEVWSGGLTGLINLLSDILVKHFSSRLDTPLLQIHLLGWARRLISLKEVAQLSPLPGIIIRGVDSTKPLVYAAYNITLEVDKTPPRYPGRPVDFFDSTVLPVKIARQNIRVFQAYAHATSL